MIASIFLSVSFIFFAPSIEKERIGTEISISYALLKDFPQSIGAGVDIIFVTAERLGASLGFTTLRSKGESLFKELLPGTELRSSTSSKYITLIGFELNYTLKQKKLSPFTGIGLSWLYFHEQSKYVYYAPGWKITSWKNYQGNGYCFSAALGLRYILKPSLSLENKIELIKGNFYYPVVKDHVTIEGLSISFGIRF